MASDSRHQIAHMATVHNREHHEQLMRHPITSEALCRTRDSPFRSDTCVALTCLLSQEYAVQIGEGQYIQHEDDEEEMVFVADWTLPRLETIKENFLRKRPTYLCLNNALSEDLMEEGSKAI